MEPHWYSRLLHNQEPEEFETRTAVSCAWCNQLQQLQKISIVNVISRESYCNAGGCFHFWLQPLTNRSPFEHFEILVRNHIWVYHTHITWLFLFPAKKGSRESGNSEGWDMINFTQPQWILVLRLHPINFPKTKSQLCRKTFRPMKSPIYCWSRSAWVEREHPTISLSQWLNGYTFWDHMFSRKNKVETFISGANWLSDLLGSGRKCKDWRQWKWCLAIDHSMSWHLKPWHLKFNS